MLKKRFYLITLMLVGVLTSASAISFNLRMAKSSSEGKMYVDPASIMDPGLTPGSIFSVNVSVQNVVDLYSWQFYMTWAPSILNLTTVTFGDFLADQPEGTLQNERIVQDEGWCLVAETTMGRYPGVDGSGWLATATFLVIASGETLLDISGGDMNLTYYINSDLMKIYPATENGYFSNLPIEKLSTAVYFNLNLNPVGVGETLTLKGILVDEFSTAVTNETVELYARPLTGSWQHITSVTTNTYGIFTWQAIIPEVPTGTYVFAAYYPGSTTYESSYNFAVLIVQ